MSGWSRAAIARASPSSSACAPRCWSGVIFLSGSPTRRRGTKNQLKRSSEANGCFASARWLASSVASHALAAAAISAAGAWAFADDAPEGPAARRGRRPASYASVQPERWTRLRKGSASGAFVARMFLASHSSFLPTR